MLFEYRSFKGCTYRLDIDEEGIFRKASKLMDGEWVPLQLTHLAMSLIESDGVSLSLEQVMESGVDVPEAEW